MPTDFCGCCREGLRNPGLRLNPQKTQLRLPGGKRPCMARRAKTKQRPPTLDFLGLTHYWGRAARGSVRLKCKTSKKRRRRALVALNQWLRQERNARKLSRPLAGHGPQDAGHFNYFGVTDNSPALYRFERSGHEGWCSSGSIAAANDAVSRGRASAAMNATSTPTSWAFGVPQSRMGKDWLKRLVRENRRQASVRGRPTTVHGRIL